MKKLALLFIGLFISIGVFSQTDTYSIEHEYHKVGVFNPEWEIYHSLNPKKFEHITGYIEKNWQK